MTKFHTGNPEVVPLDPQVIETLRGVSTATISTQLARRGFAHPCMEGVRPLRPDMKVVGPAFTLRFIPNRPDITTPQFGGHPEHPQRVAIETCPEGAVLVVDARGKARSGVVGDIMCRRLQRRGVAGIVLDGGIRDTRDVVATDFPAFCLGAVAPPNPIEHHPVDMNVPIACGDTSVFPGDIIVGDYEGVCVIPRYWAAEIAEEARHKEDVEAFILDKVDRGSSLIGVYPPNEATLAEYEEWKKGRR